MSTVAVAARKLVLARVEDLACIHSDMWKDVYGTRPRGRWNMEAVEANPLGALRAIRAEMDSLDAQIREDIARENAERAAFNAKVSALGLDPAKYSRLFSDYCDE